MPMAMYIKVIGWRIKPMVKELIYILMEQSMKESGLRTNSMVWGRKIGQIAPSIQVVMRWVKSMEKDFLYGNICLIIY